MPFLRCFSLGSRPRIASLRRGRRVGRPASTVQGRLHPRAVLVVVVAAAVMDQLDTTIVNVAGPAVRADLGGGAATIQWLVAGYTLAFAVLLVTGGRLGDLFGRRRMFLLGVVGFTVASLGCGLAGSPGVLIAGRVIQGCFGALLIPQGLGILKTVFAPEQLGGAYGAFAPALGFASIGGPILAGALIGADVLGLGWRAVFLINLPLGIAAFFGAVCVLPPDEDRRRSDTGLDLLGTLLLTGASLLIIYPVVQGRASGWPWWTAAMLAGGLLTFIAFVGYERTTSRPPVIEPRLMADRVFLSGLAVAVVFFAAVAGLLLVLSLFTQTALHFTPLHAGLTGLPVSIGIAITASRSRALMSRFGRWVLHDGLGIMTLGLLGLAATVAHEQLHTSTPSLAPALFVIGLGMGLVFGPLFATVLGGIRDHETGSASGTLAAVQQLGGALGVAGLTTLFLTTAHGAQQGDAAMTTTSLAAAAMTATAFLLAFLLPKRPNPDAPQ